MKKVEEFFLQIIKISIKCKLTTVPGNFKFKSVAFTTDSGRSLNRIHAAVQLFKTLLLNYSRLSPGNKQRWNFKKSFIYILNVRRFERAVYMQLRYLDLIKNLRQLKFESV